MKERYLKQILRERIRMHENKDDWYLLFGVDELRKRMPLLSEYELKEKKYEGGEEGRVKIHFGLQKTYKDLDIKDGTERFVFHFPKITVLSDLYYKAGRSSETDTEFHEFTTDNKAAVNTTSNPKERLVSDLRDEENEEETDNEFKNMFSSHGLGEMFNEMEEAYYGLERDINKKIMGTNYKNTIEIDPEERPKDEEEIDEEVDDTFNGTSKSLLQMEELVNNFTGKDLF